MKNTYQFIKDESERQFIKTVAMYVDKADLQYRPFFTDFYNIDWMKSIMSQYLLGYREDLYTFFGGYEEAERQIMCICPYTIDKEAYEICALKLEVKTGIGRALSHRDYLGAILGLGIDRRQVGDIIVKPFGAYVIMNEKMADYVSSQLLSIGRYQKIAISKVPFDELEIDTPCIKMINQTVSSLRMDAVAACSFGLSRTECAKLIQGEKLRCNGRIVGVSEPVKEGDVLTMRGYGKARFVAINGQTKKERIHITIERYV